MIDLRDYQVKAVDELKDKVIKLLRNSEKGICIFKAPTGSGKTLMAFVYYKHYFPAVFFSIIDNAI